MKVRFRSLLLLALIGTLVLTGGVVTIASYVNTEASAESLSRQVLTQVIDRVDLRVRSQLDVAMEQSRADTSLIARGVLSPQDLPGFGAYLLDALAAHPELAFLTFGVDANGELVEARRLPNGRLITRFLRRQGDGLELVDFESVDGRSREVFRAPAVPGNEPRIRAYYIDARTARHPIWAESALFFGDTGGLELLGVTFASPVFQPDGTLLGVHTADFDLDVVSRYLAGIKVLDHGVAFVVESRRDGSRRVIAHPQPGILTRPVAGGGLEPVPAESVADPRVGALLQTMSGTPSADVQHVKFSFGGTDYVGSYRAVTGGDVGWVVCVVAPESDVLGTVRRNTRITALVVAGGVGFALALAIVLAALIARPLRALAGEVEAVGHLDLDDKRRAVTRVIEVEQLAAALDDMKGGLRSFRKYVPAELVRDLLVSGEEATIGGRRANLTIHFSDIVGFTSIAEAIPPERLAALLGDYLEAMTEPIMASGGTVDKYIGDAVMAFWGAPRADAGHALHACQTVLANRDRLERLNAEWTALGRPRFDARAALHTGDVIVGNLGSKARLDYTVIGDAVNLASRLEGLNKRYGTKIIISATTYAIVRDAVVARPLDRVAVKGKLASIDIYELIGERGAVDNAGLRRAAASSEAFALFLARSWREAAALLRRHLEADPADDAARYLADRCDELLAAAPGDDWDGISRLETK